MENPSRLWYGRSFEKAEFNLISCKKHKQCVQTNEAEKKLSRERSKPLQTKGIQKFT